MSGQVLVVDDDPRLVETVRRMLDRHGFAVATASNGQEAIEVLRGGFSGVMLLDYHMPELDGLATLELMARDGLGHGVVVCMLTGLQDPTEPLEALAGNVLNYIRKPFEGDDLVAAVADAAALADCAPS